MRIIMDEKIWTGSPLHSISSNTVLFLVKSTLGEVIDIKEASDTKSKIIEESESVYR